jgi:hypothetical protein
MHDDHHHHLSFFLPLGIKQRLQNSSSASCRAAARFISIPPLQKLRKTPKPSQFFDRFFFFFFFRLEFIISYGNWMNE